MNKYLTDYLPIKTPLDYEPEDKDFFYNNIAQNLIEDVVKLSNEGIPINLDKIKELDKILDETINENAAKLANNKIIKYFIKYKDRITVKDKINKIDKDLTVYDFLVSFDSNKNSHIDALVDVIIQEMIEDGVLTEAYIRLDNTHWTIRKLKDIYNKTNHLCIGELINKNYSSSLLEWYKIKAELLLAKTKLDKQTNIIEKKKEAIKDTEQFSEFNYNSTKQIQELFQYLQIPSRLKTDKGCDSFNKASLQELLIAVNNEIQKRKG